MDTFVDAPATEGKPKGERCLDHDLKAATTNYPGTSPSDWRIVIQVPALPWRGANEVLWRMSQMKPIMLAGECNAVHDNL
jgi:hypothetical protein